MLHIILTVLKIIGIFLLILLGTILFVVVAVLAAPITYDISGEWNQQFTLRGKIRWLYHILGISLEFQEGNPAVKISLFGRVLGEEKKKNQPKVSRKKQDSGQKLSSEKQQGSRQKQSSGQKQDAEQKSLSEQNSEQNSRKTEVMAEEKPAEPVKQTKSEAVTPEKTKIDPEEKEEVFSDWDLLLDEELEKEQRQEPIKKSQTGEAETAKEEGTAEDEGIAEEEPEENPVITMIHRFAAFLEQESVKRLIRKLWKSIGKIFGHLRPSVLFLKGRIGMDDPALTGKIMEVAAVLYAFYGEHIQLVSDFEEEVLEAEFTIKGRIVPGYLIIKILGMGLRILLNKECRALYKDIKQNLA